jgi:outer membrane protein assembly factor BamD (BamD/ComL family)
VAYEYLDKKRGADAGYNAIEIMGELLAANPKPASDEKQKEKTGWQLRKINSSISFADYYATDKRAAPALTKAAQELFEQNDLPRAVTVAKRLTEWTPPQSGELQKTAWLILAHSYFDSDEYAPAEVAYRELLGRLSATDPLRAEVTERIAASIYRQAETQVATADKSQAIESLLSIRSIAPDSPIATTAQYDAINYLIEMQDWTRAEKELKDFESRYPNHELIQTLAPKYVLVYQESEQWEKAASVLSIMSKSGDPETKRTSLYLSAELYERAGNIQEAIVHYRDYAHTYPQPFDIATEARFNLVELYEDTKEYAKKDFWLNKLIDANDSAGSNATARSKYLAAMAMTKFAGDEYNKFSRIKLTLPIKKSMKKKKAAMDKTLDMYKKIMDFGIAEFVTEANHKIAAIYDTLSNNLMDSQRPNGLDALALEQYEILLEEQAFPFEEKAIDLYQSNTKRTQNGIYDKWVKESFIELAKILPARFGKKEQAVEVSNDIF